MVGRGAQNGKAAKLSVPSSCSSADYYRPVRPRLAVLDLDPYAAPVVPSDQLVPVGFALAQPAKGLAVFGVQDQVFDHLVRFGFSHLRVSLHDDHRFVRQEGQAGIRGTNEETADLVAGGGRCEWREDCYCANR